MKLLPGWKAVNCGVVGGVAVCWLKGTELDEYLTEGEANFIANARNSFLGAEELAGKVQVKELMDAITRIIRNLPASEIELARHDWGNTNTKIVLKVIEDAKELILKLNWRLEG